MAVTNSEARPLQGPLRILAPKDRAHRPPAGAIYWILVLLMAAAASLVIRTFA